jgi:hypothetical protein
MNRKLETLMGLSQVFRQPKPQLKNACEFHLLREYSLLVYSAWLSLQSLFTAHSISSCTSSSWNTAVRVSDRPVFWLRDIHFCISCLRGTSITARTLPNFSILVFTSEFINNRTVPEETFRDLSAFQIKNYAVNLNDEAPTRIQIYSCNTCEPRQHPRYLCHTSRIEPSRRTLGLGTARLFKTKEHGVWSTVGPLPQAQRSPSQAR